MEKLIKKNALKLTYKCSNLLQSFDILYREVDSAGASQEYGQKNMLDHELLDYMPEAFWVNQLDSIKKNVNNIKNGLKNIQSDITEIYDSTTIYKIDDSRFPSINKFLTTFKSNVVHVENIVKNQQEELNKFTKIYQMFDSEVDLESIKQNIDLLRTQAEVLLKTINEHSISLGNKDIKEQQKEQNAIDSKIRLYVLAYYKHHCEKKFLEKLFNKDVIIVDNEKNNEYFKKLVENPISEDDKVILDTYIKDPSKRAINYFKDNFEQYLKLLLISTEGQTFNRGKREKMSRKEVTNLAQLLKNIETARQYDKNDLYTNRRARLFSTNMEQEMERE